MTEVADYFNQFYTIVIKEVVTDPLINSEWAYFLTMFKNTPLDKGRIDLYLDILAKEHRKKKETTTIEKTTSSVLSAESIGFIKQTSQKSLTIGKCLYQPASSNSKKDGPKIGKEL